MLCDGGIHPTRLLHSPLHRKILLYTSMITIVITITITIAIATRTGVIGNTAIIIIIIIVDGDRTGREGGVWVCVTSSVTSVGGTPPPSKYCRSGCVGQEGEGGLEGMGAQNLQ